MHMATSVPTLCCSLVVLKDVTVKDAHGVKEDNYSVFGVGAGPGPKLIQRLVQLVNATSTEKK